MNIEKLIITQVDQITAFNNAGELEFIMDELTDTTISNSEEKVDITGRGGRKISSLKKNKAVTVKGTNGLIVGGAIAAMTGADVEDGEFTVRVTDIIVASNNAAATSKAAVGTADSEIGILYKKNPDGSLGEKLVQVTGTPNAGEFKYTAPVAPATSGTITFANADVADGTELVAFYDVNVESAKISNDSDKYSKTLKLYIDVTAQDSCDNEYHAQFIIPRADFSGTFDLTMGSDVSTQAFEANSLAGGCSNSTNLWDLIVY